MNVYIHICSNPGVYLVLSVYFLYIIGDRTCLIEILYEKCNACCCQNKI